MKSSNRYFVPALTGSLILHVLFAVLVVPSAESGQKPTSTQPVTMIVMRIGEPAPSKSMPTPTQKSHEALSPSGNLNDKPADQMEKVEFTPSTVRETQWATLPVPAAVHSIDMPIVAKSPVMVDATPVSSMMRTVDATRSLPVFQSQQLETDMQPVSSGKPVVLPISDPTASTTVAETGQTGNATHTQALPPTASSSPAQYTPVTTIAQTDDYYARVRGLLAANKRYPARARRLDLQGEVAIRFHIQPDGQVTSVTVVRSSGAAMLDDAAVNLVRSISPLPLPPAGMSDLRFTLRYDLREQ